MKIYKIGCLDVHIEKDDKDDHYLARIGILCDSQEDFECSLKDLLPFLLTHNVTRIIFRAGGRGRFTIPDWFKKECKKNGIEIVILGNRNIFSLKKEKLFFLKDECWMLSIQGAFAARNKQGKIYKAKATDKEKEDFKKDLRKWIEEIIEKKYIYGSIDDNTHIKYIKDIQEKSKQYGNILQNNQLRIGIIQKLFNLYLKYLWCLGLIEMPPHIPIDSIILSKLNISEKWTEIDSIKKYMEIIKSVRSKAQPKPLPVWELENFNSSRENNISTITNGCT